MGRKPNPLILQHFDRGAKLNDSSNRYAHTCKACGERFPKGRHESLISHISKKCPALDRSERQRLVLQFANIPEIVHNGQIASQASNNRRIAAVRDQPPFEGMTALDQPPFEKMTPLETLAEVSRGGYGAQPLLQPSEDDQHQLPLARSENFELQEQYTLDNPPKSYEGQSRSGKKANYQRGSAERNIARSNSASPSTMATAALASRFISSMVDPALLDEDAATHAKMTVSDMRLAHDLATENAMADRMFNGHSEHSESQWAEMNMTHATMRSAQNITPMAYSSGQNHDGVALARGQNSRHQLAANPMTTEFSAEYGNGTKATKPKVRGKFGEARRKEVSAIRKLGSCVRCRMLKKPCSAGDPCDTCKSVETARLWKHGCIRTRVAQELTLYCAKLHAVLAHHQVHHVKGSASYHASIAQIEVSHFPGTTIYASFPCLEAHDVETGLTSFMLNTENDDLASKLEAYSKRMMQVFVDNEKSHFMRVTLQTATNLAISKNDNFITRALELWTIVHIFVDSDIHWAMCAVTETQTADDNSKKEIHFTDPSFSLIHAQLNAAAETKAAQICKSILNEIERRLLNKNSKGSFELFLVTLITLNCIEKSTWLFQCWEGQNFKDKWPLENEPQSFANQGDDLVRVLQMILRMRDVPPKTFVRPENGILAVDAESDPVIRDFFEQVQLSFDDIQNKQVHYLFDHGESRSFEHRYMSHFLLPAVTN